MAQPPVTLQTIAAAAGVSVMTVSRALRGAPRIAPGTRQRVLEVAQQLGYRPNPHLKQAMAMVRAHKQGRSGAVLAVVRERTPDDELLHPAYQYVLTEDIQRRAERYGYRVEEFWLGEDGLTPQRLSKMLHARGIEGVLVSPQSARLACGELDFARFASVTFGYGLREPSLHRAAGNMTAGVQTAARQLRARGYRRIGLAITRWIDHRAQSNYSGAMLHFQQELPAAERIPVLLFPHNDLRHNQDAFSEWVQAWQPDALITFEAPIPEWLAKLGLRVPDDIGLVVHDWTPQMHRFAGIHQRRDHIAAAAVDLLATQLAQSERGIPEVPRQVSIPPRWVDGPSVRPAPAEAQPGDALP